MTNISNITFPQGSQDAFGRLRVSQVTTQSDFKVIVDKLPLLIDEVISGGSSTLNIPEVDMTVTANAQYVIRQTKNRFIYQSGKSQQLYWTFRNFESSTNCTKRVGYYSSSTTAPYTATLDGFFLDSTAGVITAQVWNNGTQVASVARSNWTDPLDGTGNSELNIDFDLNTIIMADFEWLGYGRINYYLVSQGQFFLFLALDFTNGSTRLDSNLEWQTINASFVDTYMRSSNQPLRWEIRGTGATSNTFTVTCATVGSEGYINRIGSQYSIDTGNTGIGINSTTTSYVIKAFRKTNNLSIILTDSLDFLSISNDNLFYQLLLNPTINGGALTFNTVTNTSIEQATGNGTLNTTGGFVLNSGYIKANQKAFITTSNLIKAGQSIAGIYDTVVLAVTPLSTNANVLVSINLNEIT